MSEIKPVAKTVIDMYGEFHLYIPELKDLPPGTKIYTESALAQVKAEMKDRCAQFVKTSGLPFAQAAILAEGIRVLEERTEK